MLQADIRWRFRFPLQHCHTCLTLANSLTSGRRFAIGCIAHKIMDGKRTPYLSGAECRDWLLSWQDKADRIANREVVWRKYVVRRTAQCLRKLVEDMVAKDADARPTLAQVRSRQGVGGCIATAHESARMCVSGGGWR